MTRTAAILFSLLLLSALACSLPSAVAKPTTVPTATSTRVPPSTQDVDQLQKEVATASANLAAHGDLKITVTEQQLTAFVLDGLAKNPDIPLTEPQIELQNGQILLSGKTTVAMLTVPAQLVLKPFAENGILKVSVISAKFGSVPIPENSLTQITNMINSNLNESFVVDGKQINIESIQVSEGKMTITGKSR